MTPLVWMNKYGHVASFKNEEYTDPLYSIPVEYKAEIERLHKKVEYWKAQYHKVKDENERLALDLGLRDYPQYCMSTLGEQNALREQTPPVQEGMETTKGPK